MGCFTHGRRAAAAKVVANGGGVRPRLRLFPTLPDESGRYAPAAPSSSRNLAETSHTQPYSFYMGFGSALVPDFPNAIEATRLPVAGGGDEHEVFEMRERSMQYLTITTLLLVSECVYGQATSGSIIGTVADPAGAAIPAAKVTITSQERGTVYNIVTNESGNYIQTQLNSGTYTIEFEAPGFQRMIQKDVRVGVDRSARVDAELKVGQVTQEIDVTGAPPTLVTDRAEVSTGLSRGDVTQLPTLNRNLTSLQLLMPGAQLHTGPHASSENPQGGMQINANGLRFGAQNFLLDGTDNNDPVLGIIMINPTIESVSDYKYTSSNYDAEFAQVGGAVIQVETKSGTNQLHGALFEFLQNDIFKARNSFSEPKGPLPLRWNQFGGALGDRIIKNKLFFFGDYQGTLRRTGASVLTTSPTQAMRDGDFWAHRRNGRDRPANRRRQRQEQNSFREQPNSGHAALFTGEKAGGACTAA